MMKNNRKLKLKLSNSNVKSFPIDFFTETHNNSMICSTKQSEVELNSSFNNSRNRLRPINNFKLWAPGTNWEINGEMISFNTFKFNETIAPVKREDSAVKLK